MKDNTFCPLCKKELDMQGRLTALKNKLLIELKDNVLDVMNGLAIESLFVGFCVYCKSPESDSE